MLKCVMYFSEYILKYIISKVKKKKMLIAITMNISFTQMPGSIGHQSNWHGASGTRWGTTEGQRPGKHWGGGGRGACYSCLQVAALILLMGAGTGEVFAAPLSTFSHTIPATKRNTF
jgi:hypothetical protein